MSGFLETYFLDEFETDRGGKEGIGGLSVMTLGIRQLI